MTNVDTDGEKASLSAVQRILQATRFAAEKHAGQRRKGPSAEPYVNHLIEVADMVAAASGTLDVNLIIAALLHDSVEDVGVTRDDIERQFGNDVAALVSEVTDDKSLPKEVRKALQVAHAPNKSDRAAMIKIADKISNLRSILRSPPDGWGFERKRQYFDWAKQVVDGLRAPNPVLRADFDKAWTEFDSVVER